MNGALLVDKPAGVTSHDVVAIVRRVLGQRSVGHTGTLDPFATGLLVILVGKATRLSRFLDGLPKVYAGTVRLGQGSDTDDATGTLTPARPTTHDPRPGRDQVAAALQEFVGTSDQMPPTYSAKKIDGERAYKRAREGKEVVLQPAAVTVHTADLLRYEWPDAEIRVSVSAGTYIRSLARDLGGKLGTVAHCASLRREAIGEFRVDAAISLEVLQDGVAEGRTGGKFTPLELVAHLPRQEVTEAELVDLGHGRAIAGRVAEGTTALVHEEQLIAIAEVKDGKAQPVVVLTGAE
ncbi:MAG: tRNA pseudouridine(55) synthase TruB [Gemmatimonadota bacterium]